MKKKIAKTYSFGGLSKRLIALFFGITFAFSVLLGRLFFVQLIEGQELRIKASENWARGLPLEARRGEIRDRNGVQLVASKTMYDIYTKAVNVKEAPRVAELLSRELGLDYSQTLAKVQDRRTSEVLIKTQVEEHIAERIINNRLSGIYLTENMKRYYPFGDLLASVLGYTTIDGTGQTGIELYYDRFLTGTNGRSLVPTDAGGHDIPFGINHYVPPIAGMNVNLTIDFYIQTILENEL
ncbi:MAG: stage V sporulation protein D, partial [Firmicutes bacterium]|nr:stage V sporulation protein D [Bacillota bacterium]